MNKKVKNLINTISILESKLRNTRNLLDEKQDELKFICPHDKLTCDIQMVGRPISEVYPRGMYIYKCTVCGYSEISNGPNSDLEENVVND